MTENFVEMLRERASKGQPNGDDLVILTGTEAVEIATEIERLEADLSVYEHYDGKDNA